MLRLCSILKTVDLWSRFHGLNSFLRTADISFLLPIFTELSPVVLFRWQMDTKKKMSVHAELTAIKKDMIRLVTLTQSIFERISHLEDGIASRKRAATADFDSDAFSEDELQSKIIKLEQDAQSSETKSDMSGAKSAVGKLKASIFSNAIQPIPRPSTSVRASTSSTASASSSTSSKTAASTPKSSSPSLPFAYDNQRLVVYTDGSCFNNGKANAKGGALLVATCSLN